MHDIMSEPSNSNATEPTLLTTEQMYRADQLAIASGIAGITLMENAGRACADAIVERYPAGRVIVLCGPGNNGGDGFVIARLLAECGWKVTVSLLGERSSLSGDAALVAARWSGETIPLSEATVDDADLVVDAIFGAGLTRPVDGVVGALIERINASGLPVCAIDVPTGIDGNTGACLGTAVRAILTVTFFRRKPGHVLFPGRAHCGETLIADIGIPAEVLEDIVPTFTENTLASWCSRLPHLSQLGHKYDRGHALVVSGGVANTGAARLGARAALRSGAGLVSVASPLDAVAVNAAHLTAVMIKPFDGAAALTGLLEDRRLNSVLIGPAAGVGGPTRSNTRVVLSSSAACVLDADALISFADQPHELFDAVADHEGGPVVMTPHGGEFARLFNAQVSGDSKIACAVSAAQRSNSVIVLKGADTVIASPDGQAAVNTNAPPTLATAGSGDVLAGIIAGLLAQRMPGFKAACAAVWLHGEAARRAGPGLIAEDLPEILPQILKQIS